MHCCGDLHPTCLPKAVRLPRCGLDAHPKSWKTTASAARRGRRRPRSSERFRGIEEPLDGCAWTGAKEEGESGYQANAVRCATGSPCSCVSWAECRALSVTKTGKKGHTEGQYSDPSRNREVLRVSRITHSCSQRILVPDEWLRACHKRQSPHPQSDRAVAFCLQRTLRKA